MKRIFILATMAATYLTSVAQTNPKIEALYDSLKVLGITKSWKISNRDEEGLRQRFVVSLDLFDESRFEAPNAKEYDIDSILNRLPGAGTDAEGNRTVNGKRVKKLLVDGKEVSLEGKVSVKTTESKVDSAYRAKAIANREAYNLIRRTINDLQEEAVESYSYEYHQNGADTVITTMALKNAANTDDNVISHSNRFARVPQIFRAPEYLHFRYQNNDERTMRLIPYAPIGRMYFTYDGVQGDVPYATKDFDVAGLQKKLAPIFKDKRIKRHELLCRHDTDFDRQAYNDSLEQLGEYKKRIQTMTTGSMGPGGESHYTIYKFSSEEQAKAILRQVMECVCEHLKNEPTQAYELMSDIFFGTIGPADLLLARPSMQSIKDHQENKDKVVEQMDIQSYMDPDGFYIIINVYHGNNTFPYDWKHLKSMVNDKLEYYKDSL